MNTATTRWVIEQCAKIIKQLLPTLPGALTPYSQRDPRWRDKVYAGGLTFGKAGCYTVCVAMLAGEEPPIVAQKLQEANCYEGAHLSHPGRIPIAYPNLVWRGRLDWRSIPASLETLAVQLTNGAVIIETEFRPGGATPPTDQHFVIAESFTANRLDLNIIDPWDGTRTQLLARYALSHWDLARAIYGARLLFRTI